MPLSYIKIKPSAKLITEELMTNAKSLIEKGIPKRHAAKIIGISESALRKRLKKRAPLRPSGRKPTFNAEQEIEIVKHCKNMYHKNSGLNIIDIRRLAYEYAEANKIKHRFDVLSKTAGPDWARAFIYRHPEMKRLRPAIGCLAPNKVVFEDENSS